MTYQQPQQDAKSWTENRPDKSLGHGTRGANCVNCGNAGFEHKRERVSYENGTYGYELLCPSEVSARD